MVIQLINNPLAWEWSVRKKIATVQATKENGTQITADVLRRVFEVPDETIKSLESLTAVSDWGKKPWFLLPAGRFTASILRNVSTNNLSVQSFSICLQKQ